MDLVSKEEFIGDVANIKGFSKILQSWVINNTNINILNYNKDNLNFLTFKFSTFPTFKKTFYFIYNLIL